MFYQLLKFVEKQTGSKYVDEARLRQKTQFVLAQNPKKKFCLMLSAPRLSPKVMDQFNGVL